MTVKTRHLVDLLFVLALFGLVAAAIRLGEGLGATTGLTDEIPWGLWKIVNMIAGVALATGGFVLAFAVHVLHLNVLKPLLRPAILTAFLGYGSSCLALLFDIGLPHRCWHPLFFWNEHSFLFEVFWCVLLYFTVTALEVSPIALEGSRFARVRAFLHRIGGPIMLLEITLSTLHHTSLRIPLPRESHAPARAVVHAVAAAALHPVGRRMREMMVVLLTLAASRFHGVPAPIVALQKAAGAAAVVLAAHLALRVFDLASRGAAGLLVSGQWEAWVCILELLALGVLPIAMLSVPRLRQSPGPWGSAGLFAVAGVVLNRVDVGILGYLRAGGTAYRPALAEIALTLGIPAAAAIVFLWFISRFQVFEFGETSGDDAVAADLLRADDQGLVRDAERQRRPAQPHRSDRGPPGARHLPARPARRGDARPDRGAARRRRSESGPSDRRRPRRV